VRCAWLCVLCCAVLRPADGSNVEQIFVDLTTAMLSAVRAPIGAPDSGSAAAEGASGMRTIDLTPGSSLVEDKRDGAGGCKC
jgi:hypothetical protein